MRKTLFVLLVLLGGLFVNSVADDTEILGVTFPGKKVIAGKTLQLNGVAYKKVIVIKVYAGGLYLENPTKDPDEIIESEQVKHFHIQYLTSKATAKKLRNGFVKLIEKHNTQEMVDAHKKDIEKFAAWFDKDMVPGQTSKTTYVPGKGLTFEYMGEVKGTIPGNEFAQMYYRYTFGETAKKKMKNGYLGLK